MKNVKLLIFSVVFSSFCGAMAKDINLRTYNADKPVNTLDSSGNNEMHKAVQNCQNIDFEYAHKMAGALFQKYGQQGLDDSNPFVVNKAGKTPRKITEEIA